MMPWRSHTPSSVGGATEGAVLGGFKGRPVSRLSVSCLAPLLFSVDCAMAYPGYPPPGGPGYGGPPGVPPGVPVRITE